VVGALAVTFVSAAGLGAYAHWVLWAGSDAVVIYLAGGVLLLGTLILALVPKPAVRRLSMFPLAAAGGLLVGAWLGPSRPALVDTAAVVTATLERPGVTSGDGEGSCETAGGSELQFVGSVRLDLRADDPSAPVDLDQREFVTVSLTVGDRWRDRGIHRSDNVDLLVLVGSVAADEPELALAADDGSLVELAWTPDSGTVRFDRLVVDRARSGASAVPVDLAGTITWTCRDRPLPEGAAEIADTACANSTYPGCVDDLLRAMVDTPGSLVAVCQFSDSTGAVIALEREEDATGWCAEQGADGRVLEVLRLPEH